MRWQLIEEAVQSHWTDESESLCGDESVLELELRLRGHQTEIHDAKSHRIALEVMLQVKDVESGGTVSRTRGIRFMRYHEM